MQNAIKVNNGEAKPARTPKIHDYRAKKAPLVSGRGVVVEIQRRRKPTVG